MQRSSRNKPVPAVPRPALSSPAATAVRVPGSASRARSALRTGIALPIDPLRVCLFVMLLITISRFHQIYPPLARLRPALFLALAAMAYALLNPSLLNTQKLLRHWPARVVLGIAIMACLSVPFGLSIGNSATFILFEFSKILIFAFLLIATMRGARDLYLFIWGYVIASGILVWMAWFLFSMQSSKGVTRLNNLYSWDANDAGCILVTALPLALITFQTSGKRGRIISAIILVGIGATIARTGSRGAFLAGIVAGLALLFTLSTVPVAKRLMFVVAAGGALVLTAPQGYWEQMRTMVVPQEDYNWTSDYGRKEVWTRGVGYMMSNPLLGIGIHNFQHAEGSVSDVVARFEESGGKGKIKWSAAHNSFLQAGSELGIPGLILWSSLIIGGIIGMRRLRRRLPAAWARGDPEEKLIYATTVYLPVALLAFATSAFFLSFAYVEVVYILAAYLVGTYVAADAKLRNRSAASRRPRAPAVPVPAWRRQVIGQPRAQN